MGARGWVERDRGDCGMRDPTHTHTHTHTQGHVKLVKSEQGTQVIFMSISPL